MISRFRVCTATFAAVIVVSAQASASSLQMDTTAPKYDTVECQEVRAASGAVPATTVPVVVYTQPSGGNGVTIPAGAAYAAGAIALIMIIGAVKEAERREAIVVEMLIKRCGEEAFVPYFQAKAEKGDADAAAHLGHVYAGKQDWPQSLRWYQVAADHKNVDAQLALGTMYAQGNGVTADRTQAAAWWQKAAGQDSPEANRRLGELYAQDQN